ncbi:MAG: hypothetical protein ACK56I_19600, partial [bacterium]
EHRKIIAWPKGEKIKTQGEKIYIFPQLDFCALLVHQLNNRGKNIILCPLLPAFFSKFPIILLNIV